MAEVASVPGQFDDAEEDRSVFHKNKRSIPRNNDNCSADRYWTTHQLILHVFSEPRHQVFPAVFGRQNMFYQWCRMLCEEHAIRKPASKRWERCSTGFLAIQIIFGKEIRLEDLVLLVASVVDLPQRFMLLYPTTIKTLSGPGDRYQQN
ncbi:hypothetical protein GOODEAATRI_025782 [Goodea atripinnis]|uniref:Uncharacterized protein n=1 Tax=Goodea atripinnis TaxID=208336 RepID=A0ABV0MV68_9TELE